MNLQPGGGGGLTTDEHRGKFSEAGQLAFKMKREADPEFDEKYRQKHRDNMKAQFENGTRKKGPFYDWSGRKHSEESKQKMSRSMKGKGVGSDNSQFGTCWITNEQKNKKSRKGDLIPAGWRLGRVISAEIRLKIKNNIPNSTIKFN